MTYTTLNRYFIVLIASIAAMGGLLFGYDTGVISGALIFIQRSFHTTIIVEEIIVSSVLLGALIGATISGGLADHFGRRKMLLTAAIAFISGTLLLTIANNVILLILARFIVGLAIGVTSYTVPLYISEMAPAKFRGTLVLINAITITGGEAVAFLVDYFYTPSHNWRMMFLTGIIPAIILLIGMLCLPETPRFLVLKGTIKKAKKILQRIRPNINVNKELASIQKSFSLRKTSWRQLFSKKIRPVLIIGIALGVFQQFFGINTVMYYGPTIFKAAGFHSTSAQILATFGMGIVNTVMSAVTLLLIDFVGRRKLLLIGSAIAAISLFTVGITFLYEQHTTWDRWAALLSIVFFIAGYCISVGSLFWLMIAEIFPLNVRSLGMGLATACQWGANFLVSITFLTILNAMGSTNTFWMYAIVCVISFIFCYYFVPETKGVPLEQIEKNLAANKPSRELGLPIS